MQRVVGRVLRAHGIKGEVTVDVRTDEPERRFAPGAVLATEPQAGALTVAAARPHGGRLLVVFDEVADRSAAERLRGTLLLAEVSADDRPDEPDEYYDHQLVGLEVVTGAGAPVGEVAEMVHLPGQDLVAVRTPGGSELLVPFVAEIVTTVDLPARRMVVEPPEGLLDLAYPEEG